jgi:DNA-binding HxlR family transcriptional regulator
MNTISGMPAPTKGRPPAGAAGDCPMTRLIGVIASKWAMPVL